MASEIGEESSIAEAKKASQLPSYQDWCHGEAERQLELDVVFQPGTATVDGVEAMRVQPGLQGSRCLFVPEPLVFDITGVLEHPLETRGPSMHTQRDRRSVLDSPLLFEQVDDRPGGRQALERTETLMPGEHRLGIVVDELGPVRESCHDINIQAVPDAAICTVRLSRP